MSYNKQCDRALARKICPSEVIGVTITSPKYAHLTDEAVKRFTAMTHLDVVVIQSQTEPAFAVKLNLDLLVAPRPIVFFDVDLWMLRPFDFHPLAATGRWSAVPDPGAHNPAAFPHTDSEANGWSKADYFNSGLFVCDLSRESHRDVFKAARWKLERCHAGREPRPKDWTDQFFLNWSVQRVPGLLNPLPFAMNFYKKAVDWGSYPAIPREIIGLHAAGVDVRDKLAALINQERVFGEPTSRMIPEAQAFHYNQRVA